MENADVITRIGTLASFPNCHLTVSANAIVANWNTGTGGSHKDLTLSINFHYNLFDPRLDIRFSDTTAQLQCVYAEPAIELSNNYSGSGPIYLPVATATDSVNLWKVPDAYFDCLADVLATNMAITSAFALKKPPTNVYTVAWTAALHHFSSTAISGLTPQPLSFQSPFSQSYIPYRHNIVEILLLEPAAEPGISRMVLEELRAANIRYLLFHVSHFTNLIIDHLTVEAVGFDNTLRSL